MFGANYQLVCFSCSGYCYCIYTYHLSNPILFHLYQLLNSIYKSIQQRHEFPHWLSIRWCTKWLSHQGLCGQLPWSQPAGATLEIIFWSGLDDKQQIPESTSKTKFFIHRGLDSWRYQQAPQSNPVLLAQAIIVTDSIPTSELLTNTSVLLSRAPDSLSVHKFLPVRSRV